MKLSEDLTVVEILGIAVKTENDAAAFYRAFAKQIKNPLVLRKIERLAVEEDAHASTLHEEYARLTGGEEPAVPQGFSSGITIFIDPALSAEQVIEVAMGIEKRSQEFYLEAARRSEDPRGREVLEYLSQFEADHYRVLETELRQLRRNADWFDLKHDLFHVGP